MGSNSGILARARAWEFWLFGLGPGNFGLGLGPWNFGCLGWGPGILGWGSDPGILAVRARVREFWQTGLDYQVRDKRIWKWVLNFGKPFGAQGVW